ncbi:WxL protein peptidoglycan domain-containing protein [Baekduia sp. Peel2402]|uniref:WxL protein peptidoglycan domain-containing protein n=1 Tax=Baekduia sp. Peel2402 TaxID=3458296 RepID=UPI00403E8251
MTLPTRTTLRTAAALLLSALGLGAAVAQSAAAADDGARWTVAPAANSYGADRKDYGFTVAPGGRLEDAIVVTNQGATMLRLALRPADAVTTSTGRFGLVDRGARSEGVASWVHLEQEVVTVDPGAQVTVPFTITPPKDAGAGDHVGGIVTAPEGADVDRGLQIRLRLSGPLKPALAVGGVHMDYNNTANPLGTGDGTVFYTIRNTGNTILTARQAVSASGPFGIWARHAGRIADSPALLPGSTWKVSAPLHDVRPALRLKATVTLTPLLVDAAGSVSPLPATKATGHAWTIPWALLLVLVAAIGLAGAVTRRARAPQAVKGVVA